MISNTPDPRGTQSRGREGWGFLIRGLLFGGRAEFGLLILGILYTLYLARTLLLPIFLALLLAAFLQPLVGKLKRLKIPESAGAGIIVLIFVGALTTAVYEFSTPLSAWMERGPLVLRQAEVRLGSLLQSLRIARERTEQIEDMAKFGGGGPQGPQQVIVKGPTLLQRIFAETWSVLATGAVVVVLIYFLLAQGRQTVLRLAEGLGGRDRGTRLTDILVQIQEEIAAYLRTITLINLGVGAITASVMALLGVPNPGLLGAAATVLNFIPYLGPAITLLLISAISLTTFDQWFRILLPPGFFICFTSLEGNVITPMILGSRLTMNPIMIFLSILFWGWVWGVAGIFLAVPILTVIKIISQDVEWLETVGLILYANDKPKDEPPPKETP